MSSKKRLALSIAGLALFLLIAGRVYYRATDDFRLANMTHEMPHRQDWEVPPLDEKTKDDILSVLNKPFTYLGKGAQSYAFLSQDGKWVLKFFKFKHLRQSSLVKNLPDLPYLSAWKQQDAEKKQKKLDSVFSGYHLAYQVHREESGILYIHFNQTQNSWPQVVVKDKLGFERQIPLDDVMFILQKKVSPMRPVISSLLNQGKVEEAKEKILSTFELYLSEYEKGIYDRDHGVMHNTGYIGDMAIHLDVGKLSLAPEMKNPEVAEKDLEKVARKIDAWLALNYPEYYPPLSKAMEEKMEASFGRPFSFKNAPRS